MSIALPGQTIVGNPMAFGTAVAVPPTEAEPWPPIGPQPEAIFGRSPIVTFYRFALGNGEVLRVASYSDETLAPNVVGKIDFLGETWHVTDVSGAQDSQRSEGPIDSTVLSVLDPVRVLTSWLKKHRVHVTGSEVLVYFAFTHDLTVYRKRRFLVLGWNADEAPGRVAVRFGAPPVAKKTAADRQFQGFRCEHPWHLRFQHFPGLNGCNFPSDEFRLNTAQILRTLGAGNQEIEYDFGWRAINCGTKFPKSSTAFTAGPDVRGVLATKDTKGHVAWDGADRSAPFMYRLMGISDEPEDLLIDVHTHVRLASSDMDSWLAGICVQSVNFKGWSIVWARHKSTTLKVRLTENDVSSNQHYGPGTQGSYLRLRRTASNTWELYVMNSEPKSPDDWPAPIDTKILQIPDPIRVGLIYAEDPSPAPNFRTAVFDYTFLRFYKGGFDHCDQSPRDCHERRFLHRIQAFRGITDGTIFR